MRELIMYLRSLKECLNVWKNSVKRIEMKISERELIGWCERISEIIREIRKTERELESKILEYKMNLDKMREIISGDIEYLSKGEVRDISDRISWLISMIGEGEKELLD